MPAPSLTRRQFNLTSLAALGLSLAGVAGCGKKKDGTFQIGVLSPKTGADAQVGISCEQGARLAAHCLQESQPNLRMIYADTESGVDQGRTKAEKLISQGAHLLVGAHHSGITAAIAQVCEQRKIPLVVNIAASPKLTQQGYKYLFRNFPTTETLAHNGLGLMEQLFGQTKKHPKTAIILHINDTYGESMVQAFQAGLSKYQLPFSIIDSLSYDPRTQDLSAEISRVKASKADLLIPISRLNDAILMIRECVKQRYQPMGIISPGSPGMYERQFYGALGEHSDFCMTNTAWPNPSSPFSQSIIKTFYELFPQSQFDLNVAFTFEAVWIAANAYERSESTDPAALCEALAKTHIKERVVCGGPIAFDAQGQAKNIQSVSLQNRQGKPKIILPTSLAEMQPIFPAPNWKDS
ncbi:ABC transporter substrate-binding protein [Candidatus Finniella inopinata]|uniref:Branched-chain amino acid ABC transporter n=1 Tax=Candidatus Finniella inopinata TaxID=1696036 RepID=A0A4Q7DID8_9PROT|nr:ABC transporter substrate-binding protein [Candidatus Finniella inopinata]RZI46741.1 branched-chain amino acid ABC transporter [Candidatus Finniella inopinata]